MDEQKAKLREKLSKRIAGAICLSVALGFTFYLFLKSIDVKIADPDTAKSLINGLWISGGALFGVDALQQVFKK
jgi:hypothetical protein